MSDESKVSQRYRELGREEPPRALDDAILAAARRAAETRPAPLVVPSGRRRWYFPLAAAAVIVLAVAVTMHVEREQPGEEIVTGQAVTGSVATPATPATPAKEPAQTAMQDEVRAKRKEAAPQPQRRFDTYAPDPKPAAAPPAQAQSSADQYSAAAAEAQRAQAEAAARADAERAAGVAGSIASRVSPASPSVTPAPQARSAPAAKEDRSAGARAPADVAERTRMLAKVQSEPVRNETLASAASPEQWLQGIADLRRQGRHEEADKALAEFRRRYPDYRLSEEVRAKVERR